MAEEQTTDISRDESMIQEGKVFAVLGYLGMLCLTPLLAKKDNPFALFHAKQGLVLLIAEVAVSVVLVIPVLGWIVAVIGYPVLLVLGIIGIVQSIMGKYWKIPWLGDLAAKIKI